MRRSGALTSLLLLLPLLTGCLSWPGFLVADDPSPGGAGSVAEAAGWVPDDVVWDISGPYSRHRDGPGPYAVLPAERLDLAGEGGANIATAVWRPDVPEGVQVPVILRISPYLGIDGTTLEALGEGTWEDEVFREQFVPHGYAYARAAVRGTSFSGGCMGFFSAEEQRDVDAAVTFYGTRPWSSGRVGMIGVSYDGTTPWVAASFGNPHLATIVPIAGVTDAWGQLHRNGTTLTPGMLIPYFYYDRTGGPGREGADPVENLCPDVPANLAAHVATSLTGDGGTLPPVSDHWALRDWRARVARNYGGSVFLVHGFHDFLVAPTMPFPFVTQLQEAGTRVKMLVGQWAHDSPDRAERGAHLRWDFSEMLKRWFDRELKGLDVATGPAVEVEDDQGAWRTEAAWPPRDVSWVTWHPGEGGVLSPRPTARGGALAYNPSGQAGGLGLPGPAAAEWRFTTGPLERELRFAGLPQAHLTVVAHDPSGGQLYAELLDVAPEAGGGAPRVVTHGAMNLMFLDGGREARPVVPFEHLPARLELFPADAVVPAGHALVLRILPDAPPESNLLPHRVPAPLDLVWGEGASVLRLPVVGRDVGAGTYPGQPSDVPAES